jgi:predicted N-acyltransferase
MRFQVSHSITAFDEARWDALAGEEMGLTHRWQRVMEAGRRTYQPLYVLAEDGQGPLAAVIANRGDRFGRRGWREALLRRLTLVVSAPFSARQGGVALRPGVDLADALAALDPILDAVCWREGRPLVGMGNVSDADLPIWQARGYATSPQQVEMVLDLAAADSHDAYLAGLARKDQHELRRARRRGQEMGVTFAIDSPGGQPERLHALMAEIFAAHGDTGDAVPFMPALFPALERELGGAARVILGYVGGELAGFFLCIQQRERLLLPLAGLRYDLARPSYLYFQLMDEAVRLAIAGGCRRIHAGMSNERQKARHGFRPRSRWFCYRASPRVLNHALTLAAKPAWRLLGMPEGSRAPAAQPALPARPTLSPRTGAALLAEGTGAAA